jgi:hypothetical protein
VTQPSLFPLRPVEPDVCRRKHGGAATSVLADKRVQKAADREEILRLVRAAGTYGATLDELSLALDRPPNQISGRFTELRKRGAIIDTEQTRPTRTKSPARVYIAT